MPDQQIKYFKHHQIDKVRWDECIETSDNGLIYALSWYLDIVAPGWDALVSGDYEAVMPLPVRRKFGIKYVFVPKFTQQLGVFGKEGNIDVMPFLDELQIHFRFADINLNENNIFSGKEKCINNTFKLRIDKPYTDIQKQFNRNCRRNIKKASGAGFMLKNTILPDKFVKFVQDNLSEQLIGVGNEEFQLLEKLIAGALSRGKGKLASLIDKLENVHAAGFYLFDKERLIFSVCASSEYGKANQAMYMLVDSQIKKHAGKFRWYDFSGSNMKGVAYFNSTFGSEVFKYKTVSLNTLPAILKWIKR